MRWAWAVLAILTGCQYSANRHATRPIPAEELVGNWTLTQYGLESLRAVGVKTHLSRSDNVLELRSDKSCTIRTFFGLPGPAPEYRVYDSGCTWRLGNVGHQALLFDLVPPPGMGDAYFYFAEEQGQVIIWWYVSDPDAWKYLEFARGGVERADGADGASRRPRW